nr:integrin alpha 11 [Penaeus japonicus]
MSTQRGTWTLQLIACLLLVASAWSFNIQANNATVIKGNTGSKFGFEVALWTQENQTMLVIGAPDDLVDTGRAEGQVRLGQVLIYQQTGNFVKTVKNITFIPQPRDYAWTIPNVGFGTEIASGATDDGPLLMCAPRTSLLYKRGTAKSSVPLGECLLVSASDFEAKQRVRPVEAFEELSDTVQFCGFSSVFGKNDASVFLTCPSITKEDQSYLLEYNLHESKWRKDHLTRACKRSTYGGWGLTEATWLSKGNRGLIAACGNLGKIVHLDENTPPATALQERSISRLGELAGSSLASCDVDGDGVDEVVVAAPFARVPDAFRSYKEVGGVSVLGSKGTNMTLYGRAPYSRFGTSVACLGDLNNDSFSDLGVGAPEHPGGGAVFVFLGSSEGLASEPSQILFAPPNVTGFGFSIAGGRDIDGNGYPDLLVGAPHSDTAVAYKAAPVPKLRVKAFRFDPEAVDLRKKDPDNCGKDRICFLLLLEIHNEGDPQESNLKLHVEINLDSERKKRKRIFFNQNNSPRGDWHLEMKGGNLSEKFLVYAEDLADEKDAIPGPVAKVNISLSHLNPVSEGSMRPVLQKSLTENASLTLNCGRDMNDCVAVTDIAVSAAETNLNFTVGERAVEASFNINVSKGIAYEPYIHVTETQGLTALMGRSSNTPISLDCYKKEKCKFTTLKIRPGKEINMTLTFLQDVQGLLNFLQQNPKDSPSFRCEMTVQCIGDRNHKNDFLHFTMFPKLRPALSLVGESDHELLSITLADEKGAVEENTMSSESDNSTVTHTYTLRNIGLIPLRTVAIDCSIKVTGIQGQRDKKLIEYFLSYDAPIHKSGEQETYCGSSCSFDVNDLPAGEKRTIFLKFDSKKYDLQDKMNLTSSCQAEIFSPSGASVVSEVSELRQNVTLRTNILLIVTESSEGPAAWVIILAVLGGVAVLAVLVTALYKLGFFKRKLPPAAQNNAPPTTTAE